jgi:hypothetical protein
MTSGSSVSFLGERISRSSAAAAPRADDGPGAGGADREELEQLVANLRLELGRERMRVELLRRDVTNMEEIVDARGVKMGHLESKCKYWREEALRRGEMVDMQTRRVMRLEQEKQELLIERDQVYITLNEDLEVVVEREEQIEGEDSVASGDSGDDADRGDYGDGGNHAEGGDDADGGDGDGDGGDDADIEGEGEAEDVGYVTCMES